MFYLATGIVVQEGGNADAREAGILINEKLFLDEEDAIGHANSIINELLVEVDGAYVNDYASKKVKKDGEIYSDVFVSYPDNEVVKVCVWNLGDLASPKEDMNEQEKTCCLCGKKFKGWGNNPFPLDEDPNATCCDKCNAEIVVPARILGV